MKRKESIIPVEQFENLVRVIRGKKVMLDSDLARIYGVPTFRFNEAVKRNKHRFPEDFMFQLTSKEATVLTSQIAMSKRGRGGRRTGIRQDARYAGDQPRTRPKVGGTGAQINSPTRHTRSRHREIIRRNTRFVESTA
jgi:hypothetical protein